MASLRAGLLLINISVDCQAHSWALFIDIIVDGQACFWTFRIGITVDGQPPCWTLLDVRISSGVLLLPASALDCCWCQHPCWTFVAASIPAGLLLLASTSSSMASLRAGLELYFLLKSLSTASISCWTCLGLMPSHGLTGSFSFWSADSFRGPSPGTLFFIVSWTLLGGPQTLFLFSVDSSSTASLRAGLYFVVVILVDRRPAWLCWSSFHRPRR